jgi:hypothetical protein
MGQIVICKEIRTAKGGYIIELRWPYGGQSAGYGEVICSSWEEVLYQLCKASPDGGTLMKYVNWPPTEDTDAKHTS